MIPADRFVTYIRALRLFGPSSQLVMAIEEMAELQKILCKIINNRFSNTSYNRVSLVDEVADVSIMLEQVISTLKLKPSDIESRIEYKIEKLNKLIRKEESKKAKK